MIFTLQEIINKCKAIFANNDFVQEAYIFGSYARNEATTESDIDFMIVPNRQVGIEFFGLAHFLEKELKKKVDVILESEAIEIMPRSIERDKVQIYERQN